MTSPGFNLSDPPTVSIVIPNFDGEQHLMECLASLGALDYPAIDVVVVDNASRDGSVRLLHGQFPWVRVLQNQRNLGFAAACNRGASESTADVVVFLNNDMRVEPDWLSELVAPLVQRPDVAATGSCILSWNGKEIDFVGGAVNFYGHGFQPLHGRPTEEVDVRGQRPILFACGGAMAARRELFLSCGGFDEDYFAFFEDIDLGWRLWVLGYRVLLVPSSVCYHKGHATARKMPPHQIRVLYERNALITLIKNYDDANLARVLPAALMLAGKRALVYGAVDQEAYRPWEAASTESEAIKRVGVSHLVAMSDLADNADAVWAKRASVQKSRRRSDHEILGLLDLPFETNCLDVDYMDSQRRVQRALGIEEIFAGATGTPRILIISNDTVNVRMAGPGIRAWEMARVLGRELPVTLAVPNDDPPVAVGFQVVSYRSKAGTGLRELAEKHDVLLVQGFVLHLFPFLTELGRVLIVDLYDPFTLENLHVFSHDPIDQRTTIHGSHLDVLNSQIRAGDFFLCASEKQRDYWIGMLAANNRVNPQQYDADPTLRALIDVVPFGIPAEPPRAHRRVLKGVYPGIGETDRVILWGGGIWEWFDPLTLLRAVARLRETRPETKVFFMGIKHPNPLVPDMAMTARALDLAKELGLAGTSVFFNEWVPYEERAAYLLEADVGVSLHFDHLETRYSYRTRVLDYIWAGLPVVCTRGDAIAELIQANELGRVVDYEDVEGLVEALVEMLDAPGERAANQDRARQIAKRLTWEEAVAPLASFCANPRPAADRIVTPAVSSSAATVEPSKGLFGMIAAPRSSRPQRPPTPWWRLPLRALVFLRIGGPARLVQEVRSYLRWLQIRSTR